MALRFLPSLTPRIIRVPIADGDTITLQEIIDQSRVIEEEPQNTAYERIVLAAGKTDLGGGISTGITGTLQNAQLEFEARTTPISTGTATAGGDSDTLVASGSTFQADGVLRGAWIVNFTDGSIGSVRTIDSEQQLTTTLLVEGASNDWATSDTFKIWNILQVEVSAGNLVAKDANDLSIDSIYTSFGNQVVRTGDTSASINASQATSLTIIQKILQNKTITDPDTGILTVYDDDDSVLFTANIYEGKTVAQAYRGSGLERRERLT